MKKFSDFKAFTIIELMVSIFLTITIIASFYKLYEASLKTERSSSIRVAENLMGEHILDTLSESFRLIGLNSVKSDFRDDGTGVLRKIDTEQSKIEFIYLSPFGSPITKVASVSGSYSSGCEFTLFNSASFHANISKLYFHNQNGFFKTADNSFSEEDFNYGDNGVTLTVSGFNGNPGSDGDECKDVFPVGSLVTGEDFIYTLKYNPNLADNYLTLDYTKEDGTGGGNLINFSYKSDKTDNFYIMPKFVIEFLAEWEKTGKKYRKWLPLGTDYPKDHLKDIVAVRFGFVLLSKKERLTKGEPGGAGTLPRYCVFSADTGSTNKYCYDLEDLNYTASVFSRVVYLSNYRYLKDQAGN